MKTTSTSIRPPLSCIGCKAKLMPWLREFMPHHEVYVDACGGSGAVLLGKSPVSIEVYNDVDDNIVNLMKVLRDSVKTAALKLALDRTPYSRAEYGYCLENYELLRASGDVEWARAYYLLVMASYNARFGNTFASCRESDESRTRMFRSYAGKFIAVTDRLQGVTIENLSFEKLMPKYDSPLTFHFVDPPYLPSTRATSRYYRNEMNDADHLRLLNVCNSMQGKVMLCGIRSDLYDRHLRGWRRVERQRGIIRTGIRHKMVAESLYLNWAT